MSTSPIPAETSKRPWPRPQWLTAKHAAILLGFITSMLGTVGSFLLIDAPNREFTQLNALQADAKRQIEQLQAASSEYFLCSQQGDLVYALSLQSSSRQDLVALLYKGNILDRATPVRNIIGSLAMNKVLDYRSTYSHYEGLNDAAREELSLGRFVALKEFEREMVERAGKRIAELFNEVSNLNQRIGAAERRLSQRQHFALALSALGATLLLFANLLVERNQPGR